MLHTRLTARLACASGDVVADVVVQPIPLRCSSVSVSSKRSQCWACVTACEMSHGFPDSAQFFISPLISEDGVEREVKAVDSECDSHPCLPAHATADVYALLLCLAGSVSASGGGGGSGGTHSTDDRAHGVKILRRVPRLRPSACSVSTRTSLMLWPQARKKCQQRRVAADAAVARRCRPRPRLQPLPHRQLRDAHVQTQGVHSTIIKQSSSIAKFVGAPEHTNISANSCNQAAVQNCVRDSQACSRCAPGSSLSSRNCNFCMLRWRATSEHGSSEPSVPTCNVCRPEAHAAQSSGDCFFDKPN